jgi:hypothetical protein
MKLKGQTMMDEASKIVRYSYKEVMALSELPENQTRPDAPEAESLGEDFWKNARIVNYRDRLFGKGSEPQK